MANATAAGSGRFSATAPGLRTAALLVLVALAARAFTFGNPIIFVDEEFYYVTARAMAHGALPYVDVWDRKPIGLFLAYLPAGLFDPPLGIWAYQLLALGCVVGTALLIHRMAERAGWERGAMLAAVLYILWLDLADGQSGQAPVFYNLPMAAAAVLVQRAGSEPAARLRLGLGAMALAGIAMQIKYAAVFEGVFFGLWLLWLEGRAGSSLPRIAARAILLVAVALVPTALAALAYARLGQLQPFLYANFLSILARHADPPGESLGNLTTAAAILAPLLVLAAAGLRAPTAPGRFLYAWLLAAIGGFLVFGAWFNHYTLPVMVPAACCAGAALSRPRWGAKLGWGLALIAFAAGQYVLVSERVRRGTPAEFAAIGDAVGKGRGSLWVYSGSTMLYAATGRPALTRYIFPTHLMLERESGATGVDQATEINRVLDRRPEVVVVQAADDGERRDIRAMVLARLARDGYRAVVTLPYGRYPNTIYRRSAP